MKNQLTGISPDILIGDEPIILCSCLTSTFKLGDKLGDFQLKKYPALLNQGMKLDVLKFQTLYPLCVSASLRDRNHPAFMQRQISYSSTGSPTGAGEQWEKESSHSLRSQN